MNILVFDGYCPFCHFWVRQLIRADQKRAIRLTDFGTLNSLLQGALKPGNPPDSVWFINSKGFFQQSDAVIEAMKVLGQPYSMLSALLSMIPRWVRNPLYRFIAKNRYSIFGKYDACPIPKSDHQERFIHPEELGEAVKMMPALTMNR